RPDLQLPAGRVCIQIHIRGSITIDERTANTYPESLSIFALYRAEHFQHSRSLFHGVLLSLSVGVVLVATSPTKGTSRANRKYAKSHDRIFRSVRLTGH